MKTKFKEISMLSDMSYYLEEVFDYPDNDIIFTFLFVVKDCELKTSKDFIEFLKIVKEQCIDKGIYDYSDIKRLWNKHKKQSRKILKKLLKLKRKA